MLGSLFQRDPAARANELYAKGEKQKAAELYLKAGQFQQAALVFAELGDFEAAVAAHLEAGEPLKAAELLDAQGDYRNAIQHYEKAGALRRAGEAAMKARQVARAGRFFEQAGLFRRAAEIFAESGDHEHALSAWEQQIEQLRESEVAGTGGPTVQQEIREIELLRAQILENLHRYGEAAQIHRRYGSALRAGKLFVDDKKYGEAAAAFLEANSVSQAMKALELAPEADEGVRAEIYLRNERYHEAGEVLERLLRFEEAAEAFEQAAAWPKAGEMWEKAEIGERAAEAYLRADRFADAGRAYTQAGLHEAAAEALSKAGQYQQAAASYLKAGKRLHAGNAYLKAKLKEQGFKILQSITAEGSGDDKHVYKDDYKKASLLLIPLLLEKDLLPGAEERLAVLADENTAERWYWQGRVEEARGDSDAKQGRAEEARAVFEKARDSYKKSQAVKHGFKDTTARLQAVAEKLESPGATPAPQAQSATGSLAQVAIPELDGIPLILQGQVESWWPGVGVFHATDRRSRAPVLLVSFPKDFVPGGADNLRHRMGRYSGFQLESVLILHEVMPAHDNVLLLYEPFPGDALSRHLPLEPKDGLGVLRQICEALATGHKINIVHQWLSPQTVLVDKQFRVKLVGLGLRDILAHRDITSQSYLSPETRAGEEGSPASDIFSLGLLGIEILDALMPLNWTPSTLDPEQVQWPAEVEKLVPPEFRRLLLRCLRKNPLERPSAAELYAKLGELGFLPGEVLLDRYEILGEIGRGGMSRVYRARDRQFDEVVAIKTLINPATDGSADRERLFREVQICRKISHPNVVRVHDYGELPGGVFVIMEYLDGRGLDEIIEEIAATGKPFSLEHARTVLNEITAALGEAHRLQVIHRDLKPGNVMEVDGRMKVLDFGIAHLNDGQSKKLTKVDEVIGSPLYMSPEQLQGQPLDGTCDLYALGVIAYNLLTGVEPFDADNPTAVAFKHLHQEPPDLLQYRPNLPEAWVELVERLLAKKPEERYPDAATLQAALAALPV